MRGRQLSQEVPGRLPALSRIFFLSELSGRYSAPLLSSIKSRTVGLVTGASAVSFDCDWSGWLPDVSAESGVWFVFALRTAIACTAQASAPRGAPRPLAGRSSH